MRSHGAPSLKSAASTVAENSSQLLNPGSVTREDSSAAIRLRFVAGSSASPQRARRAQHPLREERGVDERLAIAREVEEVLRLRIDGAIDRPARERRVAGPELALGGRVRRQLQPRRDAGDEPAERLEVCHSLALRAGRLLDRHPLLERFAGEIGEHGIGELLHDADPVGPFGGGRGRALRRKRPCGRTGHRRTRADRQQEISSIHGNAS